MLSPVSLRLALLFTISVLGPAARLAGQGALTPPGAPGPSLKSLAEIEPRVAVQSLTGDANAQYVISQPGSYYLTANLQAATGKSGIAIASSGVTLDLAGFSVVGAGAGSGVELRGLLSQVAVGNGQIRGFATAGVLSTSTVNQLTLHRLQVSGVTGSSGITVLPGTGVLITDCSVTGVTGSVGISLAADRGTVERCQVVGCNPTGGFNGIVAQTILASEVSLITGSGSGQILAFSGAVVTDCVASNLTNSGGGSITAISAAAVRGCSVSSIISGSGGATGLIGSSIQNCAVATLTASGTGGATGINGQNVSGCRVQTINVVGSASGPAVGIAGHTVHGCQVGGVGCPASANGITGISATLITDSTATSVGSPAAASSVTGLNAATVLRSHVGSLLGGNSGVCTGIVGTRVNDCSVNGGTVASGSTSGLRGIEAEQISDCRVADLTANGSGFLTGLYAYRNARNCSVSGLGGTTIVRYGGTTGFGGRTEAVTVSGNVGIGLSVTDNHTVVGCTVEGAVFSIAATGKSNVIDGNNLLGPSTRGVSASSGANTATGLVVRNHIRGATTAIVSDAGVQVGPIANTGGTLAASVHPWANFTD